MTVEYTEFFILLDVSDSLIANRVGLGIESIGNIRRIGMIEEGA